MDGASDGPGSVETSGAARSDPRHGPDNSAPHRADSKPDVTQPAGRATSRLSWRDVIVIANVVTGNLLFSSVASMIVPFFPTEAERRDVPQTWVGAVFSAHAVTMLVTAPLAGRAVPALGVARVFQLGLALTGVATVGFGLVDRIGSQTGFIAASTAARVAEALGTAAAYTAGCTIIANQFPQRVHFLFGLGETMVGVGMAAGPALGGLLYAAGGYSTPFYALGGVTVAAAVLSWCSLPALSGAPHQPAGGAQLLRLLRCPEAALNVATVITVSAGYTALRPGLAPFAAARLGVSAEQLSLYFLLAGGMYTLTGPLVGKLCDRLRSTYPLMAVALALAAVGLALFCPPGLSPSRPLLVTGMTVRELFLGGALIPTFGNLLHAALAAGLADTVATQALVSAVWAASFSVGSVLGPLAGGLLTDAAGFSAAVDVFSALVLLMALPALAMACAQGRRAISLKETPADTEGERSAVDESAELTDRTPLV
ncbi:MFS-type transporter SLC18B1-like [Amphibalanus amphitrite]|uniref:MFS-type transporter SLC18B1-like n=1 Tax=Amphibalanus amphitrite TaxID=1232801 RepID=UPI001C911700|nr:MFS-type transporter SLC18B1-like [Amphibalanus amphitrite]